MHALRASMGQATPPADDADDDDLVRHHREKCRRVQKLAPFCKIAVIGHVLPYALHADDAFLLGPAPLIRTGLHS